MRVRRGARLAAAVAVVLGGLCAGAVPATAAVDAAAVQLAERYAPVVVLSDPHQACDRSGEAYQPGDVGSILGNPSVTLHRADGSTLPAPTAADLVGLGEDTYLDLPGNPVRPGCSYEQLWLSLPASKEPPTSYAHVVTEPGRHGLVVQYWFWYLFNDWNNTHESDWEMMQVVFAEDTPAAALASHPVAVGYSQHDNGEEAGWNDSKLQRAGDHPVVFVGTGSHANQFAAGTYVGRAEQGNGFGCESIREPARRLQTVAHVLGDPVDTSGADGWIGFEGHWGERAGGFYDGPRGPNANRKWSAPLTWQDGLKTSHVAVPERSPLGVNVTGAFCSVVAKGSKAINVIRENPWAVLGIVVLLVLGVIGLTRRTRWSPAGVTPLFTRRATGEVLRSGWRIWKGNRLLFLSTGLIFIPVGVLTTALAGLVARWAPVAALNDLEGHGIVIHAIVALTVAAIGIGVSLGIASCATIAALRELDAGRHVSGVGAHRLVLRHWWPLLAARVGSLVRIGLLAISVVGIPWALERSVQWTFIEQTMLLDDEPRDAARGASRSVVRGAWVRVLFVVVLVAGIALVLGPLVGFVFLLGFRSLPVSLVNLIGSLVYAVTIPYVALVLTLLYADLRERARVR